MYFKSFPTVRYSLDNLQTIFTITDIFRRVKADQRNILTSVAYDEYDIQEGETPEILSDRIYNNVYYHWVILVTNDIIDPRCDWPMDSDVFYQYVVAKYGLSNIGAVHHYVNTDGDIVHSSYAGSKTAVSNYEYEESVNEAKRRIKVVKPQYLAAFVKNFERAMNLG
jgi:hypothetical protein